MIEVSQSRKCESFFGIMAKVTYANLKEPQILGMRFCFVGNKICASMTLDFLVKTKKDVYPKGESDW